MWCVSFSSSHKKTSKLSNIILHQFEGLHKLWDTPIASISYSKFYSKKAEKTKDDIEKQTIDLNSKEYDMSRNKEYIEDLFSAQKVKKWKKLTLLEKRVRLEYIIKNQCVKLGMETVPPLILSET